MAHVGLLEDNMRIARLCSTMLQYAGHHVAVYAHPQACLDALLPRSNERGYSSAASQLDVLILDLHLPDISGLEVLRVLSAHPSTKALPLVFCTAATPAEVAFAFSLAPHAICIEKPFTYQELIASIDHAIVAVDG